MKKIKLKNGYPCLKKSERGTIVYFTKPYCGVCLESPNRGMVGDYIEKWLEHLFTPYNEPLTIQNEIPKRKPGFYKVRFRGKVTVARFIRSDWVTVVEFITTFEESDIDEFIEFMFE